LLTCGQGGCFSVGAGAGDIGGQEMGGSGFFNGKSVIEGRGNANLLPTKRERLAIFSLLEKGLRSFSPKVRRLGNLALKKGSFWP